MYLLIRKEMQRPVTQGRPIAKTNSGGCAQNGVSEPPDESAARMMFATPQTVPTRFRVSLHSGRLAEMARPTATAATTTPTEIMSEAHGSATLTPYSELMYTSELKGMSSIAITVETVVIATLSARSALHSEQSRPEKPPPGEVVVISSVIPATGSRWKVRTTRKPRKGSKTNWLARPIPSARNSRTRFRKAAGSIVPAMPRIRPKRKTFAATARTSSARIPRGRSSAAARRAAK
jgi:hypothetical protein